MNMRDPDQQRLSAERPGATQEREIDRVAHMEAADRVAEFDIINAIVTPQFLDILDPRGGTHDRSSSSSHWQHQTAAVRTPAAQYCFAIFGFASTMLPLLSTTKKKLLAILVETRSLPTIILTR